MNAVLSFVILSTLLIPSVALMPQAAAQEEAVDSPQKVPDDFSIEFDYSTLGYHLTLTIGPAPLDDGDVFFKLDKIEIRNWEREDEETLTAGVVLSKADVETLYEMVRDGFFRLDDYYEGDMMDYGYWRVQATAAGQTKYVRSDNFGVEALDRMEGEMRRLLGEEE